MNEKSLSLKLTFVFTLFVLMGLMMPTVLRAKVRTCPPFHLRNDAGEVINPLTGENADQPYSTRHTCNACHSYDAITKGYHFQQGWDRIRDDFNKEKPWMLPRN